MRIGVIGLGFMGMTHVKALLALNGVTLAAVSSSDPKKLAGDLRDVGGNLGTSGGHYDFSGVAKYTDWRDLVADPSLDAVDICSPTHLHEEMALAALGAGKHVLVEKPIALTGEGADRVLEAARGAGKTLMAAQVLRFFPVYVALKQAQTSAQWGAARSAVFRRRCAAPNWSQWLLDPTRSGGGVFDLLIHDIDMCIHLFGLPEAVSATGTVDLARGIDVVQAQLHYSNVDSVQVAGGWYHPAAFPWSMDYTAVFDDATFEFSSAGRPLMRYQADGTGHPVDLPEVDGYAEEVKYFVECATTGARPERCLPEESASAVKLALQIVAARERKGETIQCQWR